MFLGVGERAIIKTWVYILMGVFKKNKDITLVYCGDFSGGPVVKTLPFNTGSVGLIPHQGTKIPHASWPKNQNMNNRSNVVTNSLSTLKMVHIKNKKSLIEKKKQTRIQRVG